MRGVMRHRGPDLLSVDDKVVAINIRACAQVRQIGPGAGFRVSLTPDVFAGQDTRQPVIFLFLGAEFDDQRPDHLHAHVAAAIDAPALLLFVKDQQLGGVQPHTAEFSGPGWRDPALGVKLAVPMFDLGELRSVRQVTQLLGIFRLEELAHFFAELCIGHSVPVGHCAAPSASRVSNHIRL